MFGCIVPLFGIEADNKKGSPLTLATVMRIASLPSHVAAGVMSKEVFHEQASLSFEYYYYNNHETGAFSACTWSLHLVLRPSAVDCSCCFHFVALDCAHK
jgi:hypothetical protein